MSRFFSKIITDIDPYVPGEQPKDKKYIKLNTNENPYPPTDNIYRAIEEAKRDIRLYPDPENQNLKNEIAGYYQIEENQVFVGNGSDEVLAFCFLAFFSEKKIAFADITYSFYPVYAKLLNVEYESIPLCDDFTLDLKRYRESDLPLIIVNPNAPTGAYVEIPEIERLLREKRDRLMIVDEAYIDFGGETCIPLIKNYDNLLIVQTMSKSRSLAGLRVGFAMGNKELIDGLNKVKNSFNSYTVDRIAEKVAIEAMKDEDYFNEITKKIMDTRERTIEALENLKFSVIPSKANFVFARHPLRDAEELFHALKERGILVRYFKRPRIDQYLRISIGTDEEMAIFIERLTTILKEE
ncbi:MAG: histidinol-phosphate transaminase [Peptostreptococcales bacterium]